MEKISAAESLQKSAELAEGFFNRDGHLVQGFGAVVWLNKLVGLTRKVVSGTCTSEDINEIESCLAAMDSLDGFGAITRGDYKIEESGRLEVRRRD